MSEYEYDLLVIGAGPAGQRAALQADKIAIATGTSSTRDENISIAGKLVFTSDAILALD